MAIDSNVLQEVVDALKQDPEIKNNVYQATVSRIDGEGVVWVNIAGSDTETPTAITSAEVAPGDSVNVEWRNNKLYIGGNYSNPSAGVVRVANVEQIADVAVANASRAQTAAANAEAYAQDAKETAGAVHDIAVQASEDAGIAKTAAESAQGSADSALVGLSTVQDVVGVLNWITAHGTMTSQSGGTFDPDQVYFVMDDSTPGDYHVGSHYYSIVSEPKAADINSYYVLTVDESVQNYVATHIVVDSEGLWIIPDAGGNKVLIATGSGSTYTTAGTYIVGTGNVVLASFTASGATIGKAAGAHTSIDEDGMQIYSVDSNDNLVELANIGYGQGASESGTAVAPYYTFGTRDTGAVAVGNYSVAEGYITTASGAYSHAEGLDSRALSPCAHAEGNNTIAEGLYSHSEGYITQANGYCSHAQNIGAIAKTRSQTAIGEYNEIDTGGSATIRGNYAVIVGNGSSGSRSNAATLDWSGNLETDGDITDGSGNVLSNKADTSAIPTATSDLINDSGFISEDANGDVSITRNITAGGNVEAAGDVTDGSGNTLSTVAASVPVIAVETKTLATSVNVSANSTTSSYNIPTKSGYTVAAVTPMVTGSYNGQYFAAITTSDNKVPTSLYFKNTHSSAHTNSFYIRVVYIKN